MSVTGGEVTTIATSTVQTPYRLAVDATNIYWTASGDATGDGVIMKVSQQGGSPTTLASGLTNPSGIAVDATAVYWTEWTENGSLMKVPLSGGAPVALATCTGGNLPHLVAVDGQSVYWSASDGVRKTPTSGGESVFIDRTAGNAMDLVVDSKSVFWTAMFSEVAVATPK